MPRIAIAALAVAATLLIAGCGGGSQPVEGQTTPPTVAPTGTATTTTQSQTQTQATASDPKAQAERLRTCVGGDPAETYKWFAPTVEYAESLGGGGFTVTLDGKPVTLMTFPNAHAAQLAYQNITDRLILLQQRRPTDYATVSATASQVVANVLQVNTQGALSEEASQTVTGCIATTATA